MSSTPSKPQDPRTLREILRLVDQDITELLRGGNPSRALVAARFDGRLPSNRAEILQMLLAARRRYAGLLGDQAVDQNPNQEST